ncbi:MULTISPECIES: hypothetical protein [unclassified Acinetobacter]|uniref:hypothetical protein n=1 Tax=unclassified Acinetobacter TaxID=196816 RepID=UPI0015D2A84D|nr:MULTISPECIES: hypothetical protein [unclassified Acinetobacter]
MPRHYLVGVLVLLILIMLLNLESGLGRILYLGVIVLCLGVLGLVLGTVLLMVLTFTFTFILYAAVKAIRSQHQLPH